MRKDRLFFAALFLVTLVPVVGLPLATAAGHAPPMGLPLALALTGPMHVASSSLFYLDRAYRPLIRGSWRRFVLPLFVFPVGFLALMLSDDPPLVPGWIAYAAYLFHHYQRQNCGLISLAGASSGIGPLSASLRLSLHLTALGGLLPVLCIPGFYPASYAVHLPELAHLAARAALALYGVSALLFVIGIVPLRHCPRAVAFALLAWGFYLPALFPLGLPATFYAFAIAHGAQYLVMVSIMGRHSASGWPSLVGTATLMLLFWRFSVAANDDLAYFQIALGLTCAHIFLDARVWRLREPFQRRMMRERLGFALGELPRPASEAAH